MSRAPLRIVLSLLVLALSGCAAPKQAAPESGPTASAPPEEPGVAPAHSASATSAPQDPAALLAAQTANYARAMEAALAARSSPQPAPSAPQPTPPAPSPFEVAEEFRLSAPAEPPSPPAVAARPAANGPVAVHANRPIELPGETSAPAPERPAPAPVASVPVSTSVEPMPRVGSSLEQQLQQRVRDYPQDVSAHLDYQLLLFLRDEPVPNLSAMSSLPAEDRELITAFMDGMSNFRNAVRADANMLMSRKIRPLVEMADRLRSRSDLGIPTVALCRKVEGFGRYDPIEPPRFVAGKAHPVIIYCEVENFSSQLNDGKMWETKLSQDAVLYTESGLPVWSIKTESFSDLARNRRRDFFVVKLVTLPDNLVIGRYLLKVTIIDQQANRVAEASLPLQVVAR